MGRREVEADEVAGLRSARGELDGTMTVVGIRGREGFPLGCQALICISPKICSFPMSWS